MTKIYNKLVRDKIPEIIESKGKKCTYRHLDKSSFEYRKALADKLVEEACEFRHALTHSYGANYLEEFADVITVINGIRKIFDKSENHRSLTMQIYKADEKGEFDKAVFLEEVEDEDLSN